jgi:hypothetical protein
VTKRKYLLVINLSPIGINANWPALHSDFQNIPILTNLKIQKKQKKNKSRKAKPDGTKRTYFSG